MLRQELRWGKFRSSSFAWGKVRGSIPKLKVCSIVVIWNVGLCIILYGMLMSVLFYRRGSACPENKHAWSCRGRNELSDSILTFFPFNLLLYFLHPTGCGGFQNLHLKQKQFLQLHHSSWACCLWSLATWVWREASTPVNYVDMETCSNALPLPPFRPPSPPGFLL